MVNLTEGLILVNYGIKICISGLLVQVRDILCKFEVSLKSWDEN